jgi:hypothetical protein
MKKLFLGGFVLAAVGCSVATEEADPTVGVEGVSFTNSETGEEIAPFETLSFPGDVKVGFFEPTPGDLSVTAWGPNGSPTPITNEIANAKLSKVALFERLANRPASEKLVQAQSRADALAAELERSEVPSPEVLSEVPAEPAESSEPVRSKSQAQYLFDCKGSFSYDEWFNCNFCSGVGDYDITWMWVTGDGSYTRSDKNHAYSTVSVYGGGTLNFKTEKRTWTSWSTVKTTNLANGFWVTQETPYATFDYDTRSTVSQAAGDSYHWCGNGWSAL